MLIHTCTIFIYDNIILTGGPKEFEVKDERKSTTEDGQDRYRLSETSRCFLQMADQT